MLTEPSMTYEKPSALVMQSKKIRQIAENLPVWAAF
jgi:hypothetical protein